MNLFNEYVNRLLSASDIILEIGTPGQEDDEGKGILAEIDFSKIIKEKFGDGRYWGKNIPKGGITKAKEDYKAKRIFWHQASKHQDTVLRIDFVVNVSEPPAEVDIMEMAKNNFNESIGLEADINSPEFMEFWEAEDYLAERESAIRIAQSEAEDMRPIETKTFDVKAFKDDAKNTHGVSSATIVETVNRIGKPGSLYGAADFVAFREAENFSGQPNGFLIMNRKALQEYVEKTADLSPEAIVMTKNGAWYKQYRRYAHNKDTGKMEPSKDLVVHIDLKDAEANGVKMLFWKDPVKISDSEEIS